MATDAEQVERVVAAEGKKATIAASSHLSTIESRVNISESFTHRTSILLEHETILYHPVFVYGIPLCL